MTCTVDSTMCIVLAPVTVPFLVFLSMCFISWHSTASTVRGKTLGIMRHIKFHASVCVSLVNIFLFHCNGYTEYNFVELIYELILILGNQYASTDQALYCYDTELNIFYGFIELEPWVLNGEVFYFLSSSIASQ